MSRLTHICIWSIASVVVAGTTGGLIVWKPWKAWGRHLPHIENVGGTVIVCELDRAGPIDSDLIRREVQALERQCKQWHVTFRANDDGRIEAVVPRLNQGADTEILAKVRDLLFRTRKLQFCMVANELDDRPALKACFDYFDTAKDSKTVQAELTRRARAGLPPPPPVGRDGDQVFQTERKETGEATYIWAELSLEERRMEQLDGAPESEAAKLAQTACATGEPFVLAISKMLVFGRVCQNDQLSVTERNEKTHDYFLLLRATETDPETKELLTVGGEDLVFAHRDWSVAGDPTVAIGLTPAATGRFHKLTRNNWVRKDSRSLAIILDGQVISAPRLREPITGGQMQMRAPFPRHCAPSRKLLSSRRPNSAALFDKQLRSYD